MGRVVLYIATSLDGFIADSGGGVEWLDRVEDPNEDYGYAAFYQGVESVVMGRRTWEHIGTSGRNPYADRPVFVFSRNRSGSPAPGVHYVATDPAQWLADRRRAKPGTIWLVGGSELVRQAMVADSIDEYIISVVPTLLGGGIPLFRTPSSARQLSLVECRRYASGLVQLTYVPAAPTSGR